MLRFGILGASRFALRRMLPAMRAVPDVEVVAIASRDGAKAEETARAHGIARWHASYDALIADPDVDAVYIPLPNHLHVPWSERAATAGKHVLCEKPIATTVAEAHRLVAARDRAGVVICEAAMVRVQPRWHAAREVVRAGQIGELRAFIGTFGYSLPDRDDIRYEAAMGGGVLYDTGFYPVTVSRFCFEAEPVAVLARSVLSDHDGVDVLSSAMLEFPTGQATLTCGMELGPMQRALLLGTKGHLDVPIAWTPPFDRPSELTLETSSALESPTAERRTFEPVNQYALLVAAFARAAAGGGPTPVPLEDSVKNVAVLEALYRSTTSGRWETPEA
ncbi:MAG TPA: Gfo/Idh/MocA family oxidoreductase [Polyangia bacterium]|nr:Gfo/Idh/MocA family oxidoreductase [Polyangia bacterium]